MVRRPHRKKRRQGKEGSGSNYWFPGFQDNKKLIFGPFFHYFARVYFRLQIRFGFADFFRWNGSDESFGSVRQNHSRRRMNHSVANFERITG